jgi:hypothetical protein
VGFINIHNAYLWIRLYDQTNSVSCARSAGHEKCLVFIVRFVLGWAPTGRRTEA